MYGFYSNLFIFVTIVAFQIILAEEDADKREDRINSDFVRLPINSKFWNPQLDDETNMELIGVEYLNDSNKTVLEVSQDKIRLAQNDNYRSANRNWTTNLFQQYRKGERFVVWGLLNLLRPMNWGGESNLISQKDVANNKSPK